MNILEKLEAKYGFTYPELYKRIYADGRLDWDDENMYDEAKFAELAVDPPFLLLGYDFQMPGFEVIQETFEEIHDPEDYRQIPEPNRFVPFGETSGGDIYAFQYDLQNGEDVPVTLLPHDDCIAIVQAKNLQDFMFRSLLIAATEINECLPLVDKNGNRQYAINTLRTHSPYLTSEQVEILTDVYNRKVTDGVNIFGDPIRKLISDKECDKILRRMIKFDKLNYEFEYMGEELDEA